MRRRRGPFRRRGMRRPPPFGRPGRRGLRRGNGRNALPSRLHKELRRANHLTEQGDHANAAVIFERLANKALDHNVLRHAPMLFLQAAHAYVLAGEVEKGVDLAQSGLTILAESQRWGKLHTAGQRVADTLSDAGYTQESADIQAWLDDTLDDHRESLSPTSKQSSRPRAQLPPKCPYCGATVRSDEVSWIDKNAAECAYCGSAVQTTG